MRPDRSASILAQTIAMEKENKINAAIALRNPEKYPHLQVWARLVLPSGPMNEATPQELSPKVRRGTQGSLTF